MKRPTPSSPRPTSISITRFVEVCDCPRCQSAISRGNVFREVAATRATEDTQRTTQAYCEFCKTIFCETQVLEGGLWRTTDGYSIVKNARKQEAFFKRLAEVNGDRRIVGAKLM